MNEDIENLKVKDLLGKDSYLIPIYQRNYAWSIEEVTQLIQDIADYAKDNSSNNYYIGNLIVFPKRQEGRIIYETIDGQQRVTTLTILMCSAKRNSKDCDLSWYHTVNISFDHRENSNYTLNWIFSHTDYSYDDDKINSDIIFVYNRIWSIIEKICSDKGLPISSFLHYCLNNVKILRIAVPKETNLNHYFEIMNSRGKQLEQHEIVKAWLMEPMKDNPAAMSAFNLIWEACSNMERYVQMNFNKDLRNFIFDNNGTGEINVTFDQIVEYLDNNNNNVTDLGKRSLLTLFDEDKKGIDFHKPWEEERDREYSENYQSLITFPNFLLHVLKIMFPEDPDIVLDDKRITKVFQHVINATDDELHFAKQYIKTILEARLLFDKYIIKGNQDKWTLKRLIPQMNNNNARYYYRDTFSSGEVDDDSGQNHEIIMLLSMFHVSFPTQIYKNWMNAALFYIYNNKNLSAADYIHYLRNLSKSYMLDRYLLPDDKKLSFDEIIYKNKGLAKHSVNDIVWGNINIDEKQHPGENIENFVFNFYDYILWTEQKNIDFDFSYRTSVEHFYPQHPTEREPLDWEYLQSFGNLCLISRGMNSKFTNNLPKAKNENFGNPKMMKNYSLKLQNMMNCIKMNEMWDESKIEEKEQEAKNKIKDYLEKIV